MKKIALIVPCFNEEARLNLEEYKRYQSQVDFYFADDGSTDDTRKIIMANGFPVFSLEQNKGKGAAVHSAFEWLKNQDEFHRYDWIGYWDADLSIPLETILHMQKYLEFYPDQAVDAIWASRNRRLGSRNQDPFLRHLLGRAFAKLSNFFLSVRAHDSQCGAKLFRPHAAHIAFQSPFISRWIFDLEILLRLEKHHIVEFPLISWDNAGGSKLKLSQEALRIMIDLIRIRKRYR